MLRNLLICGLVAGLFAGVAAAGFAAVVGEPSVEEAIAYERSGHGSGAHDAEPAPVSRELQKRAGLLIASGVYGLALGGIFALVFALAYGRVSRGSPRGTAWGLAAAAFVVVYLVPFVKYPANPPAVGDPETIGSRTALYGVMVAISVVAAIAAVRLRPALARRVGQESSGALALLAYVGLVVAGGLALPAAPAVPAGFPAETLWTFREASLGMQAVLWASLGLVFAHAAQRVMTARPLLPWRERHARTSGSDA